MSTHAERLTHLTSRDYATVKLAHHAMIRDRAELLRDQRVSHGLECVVVGHVWTDDPGREGGTMCMICEVVRWP